MNQEYKVRYKANQRSNQIVAVSKRQKLFEISKNLFDRADIFSREEAINAMDDLLNDAVRTRSTPRQEDTGLFRRGLKERAFLFDCRRGGGQVIGENVVAHGVQGKDIVLGLDVVGARAKAFGADSVELKGVRAVLSSDNKCSVDRLLDGLMEGILIDLGGVAESVALALGPEVVGYVSFAELGGDDIA